MDSDGAGGHGWSLPGELTLGRQAESSAPTAALAAQVEAPSATATATIAPVVARSSLVSPTRSSQAAPVERPFAVQRQPADGGEPAPAEAEGATGGPAGAMDERQLEDLLRRLYPKLRTQLARELLVARERAGLLTDLH